VPAPFTISRGDFADVADPHLFRIL